MYLNHFEYYAPGTAAEALALAERLGEEARVLAGGTDLLLMMKDKAVAPRFLIDITGIEELQGISYFEGRGAVIGAATKIRAIEHSPLIREKYCALSQAAGELGSAQVRSMATLGGNSCHASPAAETSAPLVALGATVVIGSIWGQRELPLEDFILGNRITALRPGEILLQFKLPEPAPRSASRYACVGLRGAMEIDAVNMAVNIVLEKDGLTIREIRLVMGSVAPRPLLSAAVPQVLTGKKLDAELVEKAAKGASAEAKPISDIRASAAYRREVVAVLVRRVLREAYAAAQEV